MLAIPTLGQGMALGLQRGGTCAPGSESSVLVLCEGLWGHAPELHLLCVSKSICFLNLLPLVVPFMEMGKT